MSECTVRPNFRSPQKPMVMLSKRPFSRFDRQQVREGLRRVRMAAVAGVDDRTPAYCEATSGAPSLKWRMAMMSAKQRITRTVSATVSPP